MSHIRRKKMEYERQTEHITLRVPARILEKLQDMAWRTGRTRSNLIRYILDRVEMRDGELRWKRG